VGALLGLLAALGYGASDFVAGVASRRASAIPVAAITLGVELLGAGVATLLFHGSGPTITALVWGGISGIGSAAGTLALYHGFAVGKISTVATISGVLTVVFPAAVGVALGNQLSPLSAVGIIAAVPAVGLVCWTRGTGQKGRSGALFGVIAGAAFALLFIALDRAGSGSGAWPLVSGQLVSCAMIAPLAIRELRKNGLPAGAALSQSALAGILGAVAALSFLIATGLGELVIIAVLTSMYPAVTVLLARILLGEKWTRTQILGLILSAVAVVIVATG
jgi:drug/metabolite transporter (DMT)-like permease